MRKPIIFVVLGLLIIAGLIAMDYRGNNESSASTPVSVDAFIDTVFMETYTFDTTDLVRESYEDFIPTQRWGRSPSLSRDTYQRFEIIIEAVCEISDAYTRVSSWRWASDGPLNARAAEFIVGEKAVRISYNMDNKLILVERH